MNELRYTAKHPDVGYLTNQLLIPKGIINQTAVKEELTFAIGEQKVFNEHKGEMVTAPKWYIAWDETEHHLVVPRAFFTEQTRKEFTEMHGVRWVEERLESIHLDLPNNIVPRDEIQELALKAMAQHRGGTVNLACVAGSTKLSLNRAGKGFQMSIASAYERMQGGRYAWDKSIQTTTRAKMGDRIGLHQIDQIIYKGKRATKVLTLVDGKKLRLTADHQVLTTRGWKSIDQGLQPGDEVIVDGSTEPEAEKKKRMAYRRLSGFNHHPFARKQTRRRKSSGKPGRPPKDVVRKKNLTKEDHYYVIEEHRVVAEAALNNLTMADFKERCQKGETKGLKFIDPSKFHVHHMDEDIKNNELANLEVLAVIDHRRKHGDASHFGYGVPSSVAVKSISEGKYEDVYDVVCKDPHRNFVANGIVVHNCGKGKTIVAIKYWADTGCPALVVVNSTALADQWMRKIRFFLEEDVDIGFIGDGRCQWQDCQIVVATVQTLANKRDTWSREFRRYFGVIFFDEGHHMAAPHFVKAADLFYGQRFSLTATAFRTDGLEAISMYHIGDIIYQALEQDLIPDTVFHTMQWQMEEEMYRGVWQPKLDKAGQPVLDKKGEVILEHVGGAVDRSGKIHHRKLCIELGKVPWRNEIIMDRLEEDMEEGRQVLMLSHSVEHTRVLGALARGRGFDGTGVVNGEDVDPFDRIPLLEASNPVIGTFDLAREALDKSVLDTLHVCTPFGNANDLQQSWGRIQRHEPTKNEPRARVYEDLITVPGLSSRKEKKVKTTADQCRMLRTYLKALKYPFRNQKEKAATWKSGRSS